MAYTEPIKGKQDFFQSTQEYPKSRFEAELWHICNKMSDLEKIMWDIKSVSYGNNLAHYFFFFFLL